MTSKHPFCENNYLFLLLWKTALKNVDIVHHSQQVQVAMCGSGAMPAMNGATPSVSALIPKSATESSSIIALNV